MKTGLPPREPFTFILAPELRREVEAFKDDEPSRALVRLGLFNTGERFTFRCPTCGNVASNDQRMEPMCTGPRWTDDHEPAVMTLESCPDGLEQAPPAQAQAQAPGPPAGELWLPSGSAA